VGPGPFLHRRESLMVRVRFHGRGGQGGKTASRILGDAAFLEGFNVQDFPLFGAERRGAPVTAFTRISDLEIMERGFIFDPDVVAVMDETLLEDELARPLEGARRGAVVLVNTTKPAGQVRTGRGDVAVVAMDLTGESLRIAGKPVLSAPVAAAVARMISISEASLLRAVSAELEEITVAQDVVAKNLELARAVYREVGPVSLHTEELASGQEMASLAMINQGEEFEDITSPGNSAQRHTGDWRIFRPAIDYGRCTTCMVCYVYCPESAIAMGADGRVAIDYDNCKGCMICMNECPLKAISSSREAERE
jgi:pyruvate ferredoxin oxidoreductase gamma subunit